MNKAPKYGRDDDDADAMASQVMELWTEETWKHKTTTTGRQFRPGMLSWNYWIADGDILPASPDGRQEGQVPFQCHLPVQRRRYQRPHRQRQFGGQGAGRQSTGRQRRLGEYFNMLPNGASHTITFNPSMLRDPEHRAQVQGVPARIYRKRRHALQVNMLDADMLRDAQNHPRITATCWCGSPVTTPISPPSARNCRMRSSPAKAIRCR